ncbi:MAG: hypothetical protein ACI8QZ_004177 [Chlamydiales bacterium]|jgi:hypothetical protein
MRPRSGGYRATPILNGFAFLGASNLLTMGAAPYPVFDAIAWIQTTEHSPPIAIVEQRRDVACPVEEPHHLQIHSNGSIEDQVGLEPHHDASADIPGARRPEPPPATQARVVQ